MLERGRLIGLAMLAIATAACGKFGSGGGNASASAAATSGATGDATPKKADTAAKSDTSASARAPALPADATSGNAATAMSHLSDDCQIAVRLDVSRLVANPSFAREVEPPLDEILAASAPKNQNFAVLQAFWKATSIDYKKSIHDITLCVTNVADPERSWSIAISAGVKPGSVAPAIAGAVKTDDPAGLTELDGRKVYVAKGAATIGQAADGVVIIAPTNALFQNSANSKGADSFPALEKVLSFTLQEDAAHAILTMSHSKDPGAAQAIKAVSGFVDLDARTLEAVLNCGTADEAKKLDARLAALKEKLTSHTAPNPIMGDAAKNLTSHAEGPNVIVDIGLSQDSFDQAVKMLGDALKGVRAKI